MALAALLIMMGVLLHGQTAPLSTAALSHIQQTGAAASLDFEFFRTRVEPILLKKRKGLARCYVCHSQGTAFRLQPLSSGSASWNETESRRNFEATLPFVVPGNPLATDYSQCRSRPKLAASHSIPVASTGPRKMTPNGKPWLPGYAEQSD
jgi:hypothetical protein